MTSILARSLIRVSTPLASTAAATLAFVAATPAAYAQESPEAGLDEIVVTATRREESLQTIPVAVSAYAGESLAENKVFSASDLANAVPSFSYTAFSPLDQELNIRGITNTRIDSPSADPSTGTFIDGVYVGRSGDYNSDFFDLERVEVIRGPQGVLLGRNVVGGALSVITAAPSQQSSSRLTAGYGNYDAKLLEGYLTGPLTDTLAGRLSIQYRSHDGYARDILHNRDLEDLDSKQVRAQLLWQPDNSWRIRGIFDYTDDKTNGHNSVAVDGGIASCETTYLAEDCTRPWSNARAYLGLTDPRVGMPWSPELTDGGATNQYLTRSGFGLTLDVSKDMGFATFNSLTNYRSARSGQLFSQTAMGPAALGWDIDRWFDFMAFVDDKYGPRDENSNSGVVLFELANAEKTRSKSFSQEFRLTSNTDGPFDWIVGAYYNRATVDKFDIFIAENFFGSVFDHEPEADFLSVANGESHWWDYGVNKSYAVFGQLGFKFTDTLKLTAGLRQTWEDKRGTVTALAVKTGDRFHPEDPIAVVTLDTFCYTPSGEMLDPEETESCEAPNDWRYGEGEGYTTSYKAKWNKLTPQATLGWNVTDDVYSYLTYSEGFKGGGFDSTPSNPESARLPFDPETVKNYEFGIKSMFWNRRVRLNANIFLMDYNDLQVEQINSECLCGHTGNAGSAEIKGIEAELAFMPVDNLTFSLSGSHIDAKYKVFIEEAEDENDEPLDSSGNQLQRTPATQIAAGINYQLGMVNFDARYSWQSRMFWATDNIAKEPSYGLLDARISFGPESKKWAVAVWAKNLTDELYRTNVIPFSGDEVSQFGVPRTYGLDMTFRY